MLSADATLGIALGSGKYIVTITLFVILILFDADNIPSDEPRQANLCLRAFRHDKFQLRMLSHSEGPEIWLSV